MISRLMKIRIPFLFVCLLILSSINPIIAQDTADLLNQKTSIVKGSYTIEIILGKINEIPGINITYNDNNIPFDKRIEVDSDHPSIKKVLDLIVQKAPIEYIVKGDYIIIKKKTLSKKYEVYGKVRDALNGENMIGVNIYVIENLKGNVSDIDGNYSLQLKPGDYHLVFSYLGYAKHEIFVTLYEDQEINVQLQVTENPINEVRITGQRQIIDDLAIGRNIKTIKAREIRSVNTNNATDILHARIPGVWATKTSGAPGDQVRVRIRGINSLFGSVDPLYVIDGVSVPVVNLRTLGVADLNIHDIESLTVLKDASSTALYGYQGGNGVILIDTKKGTEKKTSFSVKYGVQRFTNYYDLMNTREFLGSLDSAKKKLGLQLTLFYPEYSDSLYSTNWQDVIFQDGVINEYQLSTGNNFKNTSYYISGNYLDHHGIVTHSSYKRYTLNARVGQSFFNNKLNVNLIYRGAKQENENNLDIYGGNPLIYKGISKPPCYYNLSESVLDNLQIYYNYPELLEKQSADSLIKNFNKSLDVVSNSLNGFVAYRLTHNLVLNISSSLTFKHYNYRAEKLIQSSFYASERGKLLSNENYIISNQYINLLYNKQLNNHTFKFATGYRNYTDNIYWNVDSLSRLLISRSFSRDESIFTKGSMALFGESGAVIRKINSYIGCMDYNYKYKYYVSVIANQSHLKEGKYVDVKTIFPSVAVIWDIARERRLNRLSWLNHINLFVNWGQSGNYPLNSLSNDLHQQSYVTYSDTFAQGISVNQFANHFLKHERINEYNLGIELSLFNERMVLITDYFFKTNSNLIILRDIPYYYGGGSMFLNVGKTENRGIEWNLELVPVMTTNFKWFSKFGYSANNQIIKKLDITDTLNFIDTDILFPDFIVLKNERLGSILGFKYLGRWTPEDDAADNIRYVEVGGLKYFKNDTITRSVRPLTDNDKVIIGNSLPDFTFNWYNSFSYKKFTLDLLWYGVIGVDKYNATRAATYMAGINARVNSLINDTISALQSNVYYESSAFIEDASFIRLKQLTLSYETGIKIYDPASITFSLSLENLVTLTRYKGYDPEASIYTDNAFSDNAIDRGAYPNPKTVYFTIQLTF